MFSAKRSASSGSPTDSTLRLFTAEKLRSDSRSSFKLRLEDDATLEAEEPIILPRMDARMQSPW